MKQYKFKFWFLGQPVEEEYISLDIPEGTTEEQEAKIVEAAYKEWLVNHPCLTCNWGEV